MASIKRSFCALGRGLKLMALGIIASVPMVVLGAVGLCAAYVSVRQSYYFGSSGQIATTDFGKESMGEWLALIDVSTALLPIALVVMWATWSRKMRFGLGLLLVMFVGFSITNNLGFAASERSGASETRKGLATASDKARAAQASLIAKHLRWNSPAVTSTKVLGAVDRRDLQVARRDALASNERLIASVGVVDPKTVYSLPADAQATALSKLSWGLISQEGIALMLGLWASVLVILAKPVFLGLAAHTRPWWMGGTVGRPATYEAPRVAAAEAPAQAAQVEPTRPLVTEPPPSTVEAPPTAEDAYVSPAVALAEQGADTPAQLDAGLEALTPVARPVQLAEKREDRERRLVKQFLEEMTAYASAARHSATTVYQWFCRWHQGHGFGTSPMSQTQFGRYTQDLGVAKATRGDKKKVEYRIRLTKEFPAAQAPALQRAA